MRSRAGMAAARMPPGNRRRMVGCSTQDERRERPGEHEVGPQTARGTVQECRATPVLMSARPRGRRPDGRQSQHRLSAFARSMLDGTPIDMREIDYFGHGTFAHFMRALAVAWPDPPPSIEEMQRQGWRELTGEEFRRRAREDDPDEPGARPKSRPTPGHSLQGSLRPSRRTKTSGRAITSRKRDALRAIGSAGGVSGFIRGWLRIPYSRSQKRAVSVSAAHARLLATDKTSVNGMSGFARRSKCSETDLPSTRSATKRASRITMRPTTTRDEGASPSCARSQATSQTTAQNLCFRAPYPALRARSGVTASSSTPADAPTPIWPP
jgi:hypothetical protein